MALKYKLEYNQKAGASDDSCYVHLKLDPEGYYRFQIGKEIYESLDSEDQDELADGLFEIKGITEISIMAYRIWYMKSPAYEWKEVNEEALNFIMEFFEESSLQELQGSAKINGEGLRLISDTNRRAT